jgi:heptosyltransferase-3
MKMSDVGERPRILVITLRRLGDVLLTTPLIRSLKMGCAGCSIDALVFRGTEGVLAGNRDLDEVIAIPERPSATETVALARRLWRGYDLAVPTQTGDRPAFLAWVAGRRRIGFVADAESAAWLKRRIFDRSVPVEAGNHRVIELLRLADCLGVPRRHEIVCPASLASAAAALPGRYAVVHANPMYRIRRWTDDGWRALARALADRGLTVVATGGPDSAEKDYLDRVWQGVEPPIVRLDGTLGWPDLAALLRGAAVYVGPDTSMTHLAAGAGAPTVALYGPASPSLIGPWPIGGLATPWARAGTIQRRGNVWVVQNPLPCLPCDKLGCEGHIDSYSQCLDELSVQQVLAAVDQALSPTATVVTG